MKVLVVDDIIFNRMLLTEMVRGLGHQAIEASNGADALEAIARELPGIVFMDIEMPVMDGFEATARLRRSAPAAAARTRVVALTAHPVDELRRDHDTEVFDEVIVKPFNLETIRQAIGRAERP